MPFALTDDGVKLYYEETGSGRPVILVHEFAGDLRSCEPQMRHFGKRYRAIAFNARGFPPSDVPEQSRPIRRARAADDILSGARSPRRTAGARRRPLDGRLRDAAFRSSAIRRARCRCASPAAATAPNRTSARSFAPKLTRLPASSGPRAWRRLPSATPMGRPACSTRTRIRAVTPSSRRCWPSTRRSDQQIPSRACSTSGRRSMTLVEEMKRLTVPTLIADRRRGLALPSSRHSHEAKHPVGRARGDPELRPCHQHRRAGGI